MRNNNFVSIRPEAPPSEILGLWSGNMGPYLVTFDWQKDGEGVFCYSYGSSNVLQRVKYRDHKIFHQDGLQLKISKITLDFIIVHAPYFAGNDSTLYKDEELKNASPYCATVIKKGGY
jgi:hypothetical protein